MKIKLLHPLVSCICITSIRSDNLIRSIICFDQQNYPNRELIISYPFYDIDIPCLVRKIIKATDIRIIEVPRDPEISLGKARNQAIEKCNGEYICMWDDDDLYDYRRISNQFNGIIGNSKHLQASILNRIMLYNAISKRAYISLSNSWSGSLLCNKTLIKKIPCDDQNQHECKSIINHLVSKKLIYEISDKFHLYIFVYNGKNMMNEEEFTSFIKLSKRVNENYLSDLNEYIDHISQVKLF